MKRLCMVLSTLVGLVCAASLVRAEDKKPAADAKSEESKPAAEAKDKKKPADSVEDSSDDEKPAKPKARSKAKAKSTKAADAADEMNDDEKPVKSKAKSTKKKAKDEEAAADDETKSGDEPKHAEPHKSSSVSASHRHRLTSKQRELLALQAQIELFKALPESMAEDANAEVVRLEKQTDRLKSKTKILQSWEPEEAELHNAIKQIGVQMAIQWQRQAAWLEAAAQAGGGGQSQDQKYQVQRGHSGGGGIGAGWAKGQNKDEMNAEAKKLKDASAALIKAVTKITGEDPTASVAKGNKGGKTAKGSNAFNLK